MEKTINVNGKEVKFETTGSTPRRYRKKFNSDLFLDIAKLQNAITSTGTLDNASLECFENLCYIMAKQADPSIPDDPDEWLDQFEILSIYEILPQIMGLWGANVETLDEPKKKAERQSGN